MAGCTLAACTSIAAVVQVLTCLLGRTWSALDADVVIALCTVWRRMGGCRTRCACGAEGRSVASGRVGGGFVILSRRYRIHRYRRIVQTMRFADRFARRTMRRLGPGWVLNDVGIEEHHSIKPALVVNLYFLSSFIPGDGRSTVRTLDDDARTVVRSFSLRDR